jgi:hypothetical protein
MKQPVAQSNDYRVVPCASAAVASVRNSSGSPVSTLQTAIDNSPRQVAQTRFVSQVQGSEQTGGRLEDGRSDYPEGLEADSAGGQAIQLTTSLSTSLGKVPTAAVPVQLGPGDGQTIQLLSDFESSDWKGQVESREDISKFGMFKQIADAAALWDGLTADQNLVDLKKKITALGEAMLSNDGDVDKVYAAIQRYFPDHYLSKADVAMVKKYNFDGPIMFSAENAVAWLRLATGQGTVDDLRYIHHEIYEIKQIEGSGHGDVLTKPEEESFGEVYDPSHASALRVELRFLAEAVNLIYKKHYTWVDVACSDQERAEEFEAAIPKDAKKGEHTFAELAELLTELKAKKLASG